MTPDAIKAAISRAGTTQTAIARYLDVSPSCVGRVINGAMRSQRIEAELQKITGKPIHGPAGKPGRKKSSWNGSVAGAQA